MELLDIMNERFSVRKYVDKPVEPEKLDKILNAAHAAPTAANGNVLLTECRQPILTHPF